MKLRKVLKKVLILHKKSTFQIQAMEHKESRFLKLLEEGSEVVTRVKLAHEEHLETLKRVQEELDQRKIEYRSIARSKLSHKISDIDLMISVGGDGTFLDASHFLDHVPILGVNSSSSSSFGHFCLANEKTIGQIMDDIQSDSVHPYPLARLDLTLNDSLLLELVLNEILIAHSNPAATSRYFIDAHGQKEEQKSSGIWIGTAAGSTGSIRSAGGKILPITDTRFQFIVREPCMRPNENWHLLKGLMNANEQLKITSRMRTGAIYIDGQHLDHQFSLADKLVVKRSTHDLNAYINPAVNDRFN